MHSRYTYADIIVYDVYSLQAGRKDLTAASVAHAHAEVQQLPLHLPSRG